MELAEDIWPAFPEAPEAAPRPGIDLGPVRARAAAGARAGARLVALAALGALVLGIAIGVNALALSGLVLRRALPDGHDVRPHLVNTAAYARAFEEGTSWPRWLPDLSAGHGGPNPLLYSALPFHLTARLVNAGLSGPQALALAAMAGMLAAFGGMWFWAARAGAGWAAALAAATLYTLAPYHLFDLYGRFAYPELLAMGLAPWLFGVLERPADRTRAALALGAGLALLWLTHNLSVILFGGLLAARALAIAVRERSWAPLGTFAAGGLVAAGLAAFAWLPSLADMPRTRIAADTSMSDGWRVHLLEPARLLDAHWPGTRAHLPVYPGRLHLALAALAVLGAVWRARQGSRRAQGELVFAAGVAALGALMLTPSALLWAHSPLPMVQFPWRFLAPVTLGLSLLAAEALPEASPAPERRFLRGALALGVIFAACVTSAPLCDNGTYRGTLLRGEDLRGRIETGDFENKYLPLGAHMPLRPASPVCAIVEGQGRVVAQVDTTHRHELDLDAFTPLTLELRQYDFEGWTAVVDRMPATVEHEDGYGLMRVRVPEGRHHVVIELALTPVHAWTMALSVAVGVLVLALLIPIAPQDPEDATPRRLALRAVPAALVALALAGTLMRAFPQGDARHAERARLALLADDIAGARAELARIDPAGPYGTWAARLEALQRDHGALLSWAGGPARRVPRLDLDQRLELPRGIHQPRAAQLSATLDVVEPGLHELSVESDGPALLRLDGQAVISNPGAPPADLAAAREHPLTAPVPHLVRSAVRVHLARGPHAIDLTYHDATGRGAARVWWRPPNRAWSLIPQEALAPAPAR